MNDSKPKVMHRPDTPRGECRSCGKLCAKRAGFRTQILHRLRISLEKRVRTALLCICEKTVATFKTLTFFAVKEHVSLPLNFEMGATQEMLRIALKAATARSLF